ncbi:hypothetical protein H696_00500 [Fonticula alba]|uniref:Ku domain-containing protein n=1 Tax=Fonticula alba TaxID=691883 RepID=A0A058ZEV4_FONAL|nr:hypothetical protein H696_00500 [Fonticula alba]KCV72945.1 hypothetical protein H696_00500 [Fonticula alba]|eukprot:XP_009492646.1 hypothetical protein H696_00500 [Fonticula alba]
MERTATIFVVARGGAGPREQRERALSFVRLFLAQRAIDGRRSECAGVVSADGVPPRLIDDFPDLQDAGAGADPTQQAPCVLVPLQPSARPGLERVHRYGQALPAGPPDMADGLSPFRPVDWLAALAFARELFFAYRLSNRRVTFHFKRIVLVMPFYGCIPGDGILSGECEDPSLAPEAEPAIRHIFQRLDEDNIVLEVLDIGSGVPHIISPISTTLKLALPTVTTLLPPAPSPRPVFKGPLIIGSPACAASSRNAFHTEDHHPAGLELEVAVFARVGTPRTLTYKLAFLLPPAAGAAAGPGPNGSDAGQYRLLPLVLDRVPVRAAERTLGGLATGDPADQDPAIVPAEHLARTYRYGKQRIAVTRADELIAAAGAGCPAEAERSLQLICFFEARSLPPAFALHAGPTYWMVAVGAPAEATTPGGPGAGACPRGTAPANALALAHLVGHMRLTGRIALLRYVRVSGAAPQLMLARTQPGTDRPVLLLTRLPFAGEVLHSAVPGSGRLRRAVQAANPAADAAMDALIDQHLAAEAGAIPLKTELDPGAVPRAADVPGSAGRELPLFRSPNYALQRHLALCLLVPEATAWLPPLSTVLGPILPEPGSGPKADPLAGVFALRKRPALGEAGLEDGPVAAGAKRPAALSTGFRSQDTEARVRSIMSSRPELAVLDKFLLATGPVALLAALPRHGFQPAPGAGAGASASGGSMAGVAGAGGAVPLLQAACAELVEWLGAGADRGGRAAELPGEADAWLALRALSLRERSHDIYDSALAAAQARGSLAALRAPGPLGPVAHDPDDGQDLMEFAPEIQAPGTGLAALPATLQAGFHSFPSQPLPSQASLSSLDGGGVGSAAFGHSAMADDPEGDLFADLD